MFHRQENMSFIRYIKAALRNLISSKLRSFLAILGILVGTASVVALITSSQLATEHALDQFKELGTNLLAMDVQPRPGQQQTDVSQQITLAKIPQIKHASQQIALVAPYTSLFNTLYFEGKQTEGQVLGATAELAEIVKIQIDKGRFVSYLDRNSFFCVIGSDVGKDFLAKGIANPIGHQISIGKFVFTIIGVAKHWQPNWFLYADINKGAIIPLATSFFLSKDAQINNLLFRLVPDPDIAEVQNALADKMSQLYPQLKTTFRSPDQIIGIMKKQQNTFTWLLGSIGGIALLVGGIGVMNIMYVSVIERRREIGIRMAVGARRANIRRMFLVEAIILTLFGGLLGILVGVAIASILALATGWGFRILLFPPILGFVISVLVGVISGFYPAYRASNLDPIETLRGE
ncbi:ABC transporter permease [Coxiella burnetii]|uniref:ABC transporter permease n=2 Tax=Coxiella burnetii TaxID=777 RepID=UPI002231E44C|nr:ABC transporter permease [Coxiella burnetii]